MNGRVFGTSSLLRPMATLPFSFQSLVIEEGSFLLLSFHMFPQFPLVSWSVRPPSLPFPRSRKGLSVRDLTHPAQDTVNLLGHPHFLP